ncbi:MAG TPA: peptidase, partial [Candidatus Nitrosotenuis sp.]|nr:peptidase [Candidatus Nitrosotenuis sp.]
MGIIFQPAFGHGLGFETLPPQMLGDRKVAMEISSTVDNATNRKQIVFSMFDTNTGITVRDVTYNIKAIKNNHVLFEGNYQTKNGVLELNLIPDANDKVTVQEKKDSGVFDFLTGSKKSMVEAKGRIFEVGGLYKFSIGVISAENYSDKTDKSVQFESGLSFAQTISYTVNDEQFGVQNLKVTSYYDLLDELSYGPKTKSVFFSMPFEWTNANINQTSVVHQEIFIPKTFGALQVSEYEVSANGLMLGDESITIDDFTDEYRVIHILLYQTQLESLYNK